MTKINEQKPENNGIKSQQKKNCLVVIIITHTHTRNKMFTINQKKNWNNRNDYCNLKWVLSGEKKQNIFVCLLLMVELVLTKNRKTKQINRLTPAIGYSKWLSTESGVRVKKNIWLIFKIQNFNIIVWIKDYYSEKNEKMNNKCGKEWRNKTTKLFDCCFRINFRKYFSKEKQLKPKRNDFFGAS